MRPSVSRSKPIPSKWDDAQKWLVKNKPRSSNADDRRLLGSSRSSIDGVCDEDVAVIKTETKRIDCNETLWGVTTNKVCLRDVGTEMTPMASKEPSRTATPLGASTPVASRSSTPKKGRQGNGGSAGANGCKMVEECDLKQIGANRLLESRAVAWDEAERAKCLARYKREELKIESWENHEIRKAEMEMRRMEMKAERMKSRAKEKLSNSMSATRRIAEEKRGNAESKLSKRSAKTSEKANYIRRTGHLPLSFLSLKLPSLCSSCTID